MASRCVSVHLITKALERSNDYCRLAQRPFPQAHGWAGPASCHIFGQNLIQRDLREDRDLGWDDDLPVVIVPAGGKPGGPAHRCSDRVSIKTEHHHRVVEGSLDRFGDCTMTGIMR